MPFSVVRPDDLTWVTRPHDDGEPARHVADLSEQVGFADVRASVWRYDPGAAGLRHVHAKQEETFVVLAGTLSMYLGDPAERHDLQPGGVIRIDPGTPLQSANHGDSELVVYVHGYPPESEHATLLDSALETPR